ncbi:SDR family oxidoreductase [Streptomyces sp. IB2014 016-6]|uniref:SDR family oxidoreductase n=1 Tax=Streptomyces sp. IB2014 016-6 TaxID=2517818 RepID=UPI001F4F77A0|nr:SDR family oxidoreductase [Streptomyces sp. IB2014 016-6]
MELVHVVYIGARAPERGEKAAAALGTRYVQLDVTDDESVNSALATVDSAEGRLDVLVHNAGVLGDGIGRPPQDSAAVLVRLATLGADGPTGTLRDENGEPPW